MEAIIGIIIFIIALVYWKHTLYALFGAFLFGFIGSLFGDTWQTIGVILGIIGGISAQNDADKENNANKEKSESTTFEKEYEKNSRHKRKQEPTSKSTNSNKNTNSHIIRCPECKHKIRVKLPLKGDKAKCSSCKTKFRIIVDKNNRPFTEKIKDNNNSTNYGSNGLTIDDCFKILEVAPSSSSEAIRTAYKKKIREYHPDMVGKLGVKLKKMAEEESKIINTAYSMLKKQGLVR